MPNSSPTLNSPFVLGFRQFPSAWVRRRLSHRLSVDSALRMAQRLARRRRSRCHLVAPDGRVFWINARGRIIASTGRRMR